MVLLIPLYFSVIDRSVEPDGFERAAARAWLWFRRFVGFSAASLFLFAAVMFALDVEATPANFAGIGVLLVFAGMFVWIGVYGGGRYKGMGKDDVELHEENRRRYRWR